MADDRLDDEKRIIRDTFKEFADDVVKPLAEEVHRKDLLVPPEILEPLKAMGVFGLSVPERFGGLKPDSTEDSMGMVIVTAIEHLGGRLQETFFQLCCDIGG